MKPRIDLDSLSESELRGLHHEVSKRLQVHALVRTQSKLMSFRIGDRVAFESNEGTIEGIVTRLNQKTATIMTDSGRGWRVSPGFLFKVVTETGREAQQPNLFSIMNTKMSEPS